MKKIINKINNMKGIKQINKNMIKNKIKKMVRDEENNEKLWIKKIREIEEKDRENELNYGKRNKYKIIRKRMENMDFVVQENK